jgi:hypothetical protein
MRYVATPSIAFQAHPQKDLTNAHQRIRNCTNCTVEIMSYNDWEDWELDEFDKVFIDIAARDESKAIKIRTELRKKYPALTPGGFMKKVSARQVKIETERIEKIVRRLEILEVEEARLKKENDDLEETNKRLQEQIAELKAGMAELLM